MRAKEGGTEAKKKRSSRTATSTSESAMAKLQSNAEHACELLKAMANPARLMVLCQIADGEKSVGELEAAVGLSQSGLSQHLAVLRNKHLVTTRRDAQTIYYSLASAEASAVMHTLYEAYCGPAAKRSSARPRAKAAA